MTGKAGQAPAEPHPLHLSLPLALAIGASAGGPRALLTLLAGLDLPPSTYGFLVQHINAKFSQLLLRRLAEVSRAPVREAQDGAAVQPGCLYLAPGGRHLVVERVRPDIIRTRLTSDPPQHGVRPSVDALFTSLAATFGARVVGVVLTGMGHDGLGGARAIKAQGGSILAEAESTCLVYGMPRALADAGVADRLVPLDGMAEAIRQTCRAAAVLPGTARQAGVE